MPQQGDITKQTKRVVSIDTKGVIKPKNELRPKNRGGGGGGRGRAAAGALLSRKQNMDHAWTCGLA
jgi:hypothetical protein